MANSFSAPYMGQDGARNLQSWHKYMKEMQSGNLPYQDGSANTQPSSSNGAPSQGVNAPDASSLEIIVAPGKGGEGQFQHNATGQDQAAIEMSKPLHEPTDKNEDAGLAPWFGFGTLAVLAVIGIYLWLKRPKGQPEEERVEFGEDDRKMLDLACSLTEIYKKTEN